MKYYLGPWIWDEKFEGSGCWIPPAGTVGSIDLRTISHQSAKGGVSQGFGFFASSASLDSEYFLLGEGDLRSLRVSINSRSGWKNRIGYEPSGVTISDILFDTLTNGSDPTGQNKVRSLMPGINRKLEVHLGGHSLIYSENFVYGSHPHTLKVKEVLQENYRKIREFSLVNKNSHHRKVLDFWAKKYRIKNPHQEFIPGDLPVELPLPHSTTITESFDTADSDVLGPDLTWTELQGDTDVVSNQAQFQTLDGTSLIRADSDLSGDDHYAEGDFTVNGGTVNTQEDPGSTVRNRSDATLTYYLGRVLTSTTVGYQLYKSVSGTLTQIGSTLVESLPSNPFEIETNINGSTLRVLANDVEKISATDTAITGNVRCGARSFQGVSAGKAEMDNFLAADIVPPPEPIIQPGISGRILA